MAIIFKCDFCIVGEVDLVHSSGRQEIVHPMKHVKNKSHHHVSHRFKYRCQDCIKKGINTTPDNLTIHNSPKIIKAEVVDVTKDLSGRSDEGLHGGGKDSVAEPFEEPIQRIG